MLHAVNSSVMDVTFGHRMTNKISQKNYSSGPWLRGRAKKIYIEKIFLQTVIFNLRVFAAISGDQCRNDIPFYTQSLHFKGPKVIGQLTSLLFLISQMHSISA